MPAPGECVRYRVAQRREPVNALVLGPTYERDDRNELRLDDGGTPVVVPDALELQWMTKIGGEMRIAGGKSGALKATTADQRNTPGYWWVVE